MICSLGIGACTLAIVALSVMKFLSEFLEPDPARAASKTIFVYFCVLSSVDGILAAWP